MKQKIQIMENVITSDAEWNIYLVFTQTYFFWISHGKLDGPKADIVTEWWTPKTKEEEEEEKGVTVEQ